MKVSLIYVRRLTLSPPSIGCSFAGLSSEEVAALHQSVDRVSEHRYKRSLGRDGCCGCIVRILAKFSACRSVVRIVVGDRKTLLSREITLAQVEQQRLRQQGCGERLVHLLIYKHDIMRIIHNQNRWFTRRAQLMVLLTRTCLKFVVVALFFSYANALCGEGKSCDSMYEIKDWTGKALAVTCSMLTNKVVGLIIKKSFAGLANNYKMLLFNAQRRKAVVSKAVKKAKRMSIVGSQVSPTSILQRLEEEDFVASRKGRNRCLCWHRCSWKLRQRVQVSRPLAHCLSILVWTVCMCLVGFSMYVLRMIRLTTVDRSNSPACFKCTRVWFYLYIVPQCLLTC